MSRKHETTFKGHFQVCAHDVSFWYRIDPDTLQASDADILREEAEDRAKSSIIEGYHSGELNCLLRGEEVRGWWNIEK